MLLNNERLFIPARKTSEQFTTKRPNINFTYQTSPIHKQPETYQQILTKRTPSRKKFFSKPNEHRLSFKSSQDKLNVKKQKSASKKGKRLKIFNEPKYIKTEQQEQLFSDQQTIVNKLQKFQSAFINQNNPIRKKLNKPKPSSKKVKVRFSYDDGFYKKSQNQSQLKNRQFISNQNSPKQVSVQENFNIKQYEHMPTYVDEQIYGQIGHKYKLQSSVVNYRYSPRKLNITVGNSNFHQNKNKQSKVFKISKYSEKNQNFNLQTNKIVSFSKNIQNHFRNSFQPVLQKTSQLNDKTNELEIFSQEESKVNNRFFDMEMSPVLLSHKKISYEQIDPLSSSLRKKKIEKQMNLRKSNSQPNPDIIHNFFKKLSSFNINGFNFNFRGGMCNEKFRQIKNNVLGVLKSQHLVAFILILLSLTILFAQLSY